MKNNRSINALVQLKAFARMYALWLAALWTVSFIGVVALPASSVGGLLALCTPIMMAWVLIRFRDGALEGVISFRRAFAFEVYVVFYAALLFAVIQYVYFQFIDGGRFFSVMQDSLSMIAPLYEQQGVSVKELTQAFNLIAGMPVIELVFAFMMQTIFVGWVLGLVVALIFRRSVPPVRRV